MYVILPKFGTALAFNSSKTRSVAHFEHFHVYDFTFTILKGEGTVLPLHQGQVSLHFDVNQNIETETPASRLRAKTKEHVAFCFCACAGEGEAVDSSVGVQKTPGAFRRLMQSVQTSNHSLKINQKVSYVDI